MQQDAKTLFKELKQEALLTAFEKEQFKKAILHRFKEGKGGLNDDLLHCLMVFTIVEAMPVRCETQESYPSRVKPETLGDFYQ